MVRSGAECHKLAVFVERSVVVSHTCCEKWLWVAALVDLSTCPCKCAFQVYNMHFHSVCARVCAGEYVCLWVVILLCSHFLTSSVF